MSRGPGRIERAILAAFEADPDNAFTTRELIERAFPGLNRSEKKHQVSVLRAAKKMIARGNGFDFWKGECLGGQLVFFNRYNVLSYAMARLKADFLNQYCSEDPRIPDWCKKTEKDLRDMLAGRGRQGPRYLGLVSKGGVWQQVVAANIAERDGNAKRAVAIRAKLRADFQKKFGVPPD